MDLTKYISSNCIVPSLLAANKAEALKELTHFLFKQKKLEGVNTALDQIMARETTESTGIGHGIAVPHARISGLKSLVCAVARVNGGVDFMAVDKNPVHLIFLICYPPKQQTTYLNFIATVAKLLRDEENMQAIMNADGEEAIFSILEKVSSAFEQPEEVYKKIEQDPELGMTKDAHADLILLARLQLCQEMYDTAKTGRKAIAERMENIRALVDPRILRQFDRLTKRLAPALVPVEGDTCQGCFMKLPSKFAQQVRQDQDHIHACPNCSRFIYIV